MIKKKIGILMLFVLFLSVGAKAQLATSMRINEVLVVNESNFVDDYGQRNGWIELYNGSAGTVNIAGCFLTNDKNNPKHVHEPQLLQVICAYRIFMPFASITISTRECERFRNNIINIAATKISAGVDVGIGGHSGEKKGDEQFEISDPRNVEEVYKAIEEQGLQPVMSDYIYV